MKDSERLWAPWRLEYIQKGATKTLSSEAKDCVFCHASTKGPSLETLILHQDTDIFVIMNKFPYNPYHLMVLPTFHTGDPLQLSNEQWAKIHQGVRRSIELVSTVVAPHGFNIGMNIGEAGGAGIAPHLHMHIIPRWRGDTNFMPLIAETKALPTHNETVYQALAPKFEHFADSL